MCDVKCINSEFYYRQHLHFNMKTHTSSRIYRVKFSFREVIADFRGTATLPEFWGNAFKEKFHLNSLYDITFLLQMKLSS